MPYVYSSFQKRKQVPLSEIPSLDSEVRTETFAQAFEENPLELGSRYLERKQLETGVSGRGRGIKPTTKITAEEASRLATEAGVSIPYKTGTTKEAVELDIERKKTELRRQDIFARSEGGFALGAQRLGIAMATTLSDPVSAALNFVPVVGQTRYARWLAGTTRAGRLGIRAGVGAAEGLAGAAIYEPLLYAGKQAEFADYDAADSLLNLSLGTVLGAGLHTVGGTTADAIRAARGMADPYVKVTPGIQSAINAGRTDAPVITREAIDAGGARLDKQLDEVAQVAAAPAVPVRSVEIAETPEGIVARTETGETIAVQRADTLEISETPDDLARIERLAEVAEERGVRLVSESTVNPAKARIYDQLEANGYTVARNATVTDARGNLVSSGPAFEVTATPRPANAASAVAKASPPTREAALRIAADQLANGEPVNVSQAFPRMDSTIAREDIDTTIERSAEADEQVKSADDSLEAEEEEALLERKLTDQQAKLLGIERDDLKASDEYVKKIERWAQAAELAQVCLVRGG